MASRRIFTNYRYITSGDSFSYFYNGKNMTNGRHLDIHSLAKKDVFEQYVDLIGDLQEYVDKIKTLNPDLIIGDKVSNYLTF